MHNILSFDFPVGMFAYVVLALVLAGIGQRNGSSLYKKTAHELVFRPRPTGRMFMIMMGLLLAIGGPLTLGGVLSEPGNPHDPMPAWGWLLFGLLMLIYVSAGGLILWFGGPRELRLNTQKQTYCRTSGWAFNRKTQTGNWDDITGICVRRSYRAKKDNVFITWKPGCKGCFALGTYDLRERANFLANDMALTLGVPVVSPPDTTKVLTAPATSSATRTTAAIFSERGIVPLIHYLDAPYDL